MFVLISLQNTKISFVPLHMIFGSVSLGKHEVNTVNVRNDDCRHLVESLPEIILPKYERHIV
jgi:hypothetical protein